DVLGDAELVERRDRAVEDGRSARSEGTVLVAVERGREDRREEEEPDDDSGMARRDRPAAVHRLRLATMERALGQRGQREPEADPDEDLGCNRPPPGGSGQHAELDEAARDEDAAAGRARDEAAEARCD